MRILITGGAGFVGSSISIYLKENLPNVEVIAFDNLRRRGSELNLPRLKKRGITFIHGDVRNREDINRIDKFDVIIECSAEPAVSYSYHKSMVEYVINTNLIGTINCLNIAKECKADIIFLSTSRVYPFQRINTLRFVETPTRLEIDDFQNVEGITFQGISEQFPLQGCRTIYGVTKLASELLLQEYIQAFGIRGLVNRCGVISGSWQMGYQEQGFISLWVAKHILKGRLSYIGFDGKQVRDILHIDDLCRLILFQLKDIKKFNGKIYNVGGGRENSISLLELTKLCQDIIGNKIEISSNPQVREGDIPWYITDYSLVREDTGWKPQISLPQIVKDIGDWILQYRDVLEPIFV